MTTLITRIDETYYAASDLQECANCSHKFLTADTGGRITRHGGGMTVTDNCAICGFDHEVKYVEVDHTIRYSFASDGSVFSIQDAVRFEVAVTGTWQVKRWKLGEVSSLRTRALTIQL